VLEEHVGCCRDESSSDVIKSFLLTPVLARAVDLVDCCKTLLFGGTLKVGASGIILSVPSLIAFEMGVACPCIVLSTKQIYIEKCF